MRHTFKLTIAASVVLSGTLLSTAQSACVNDYAVRTIAGEFNRSVYVVLATAISHTRVPESSDQYFLAGQNTTIRITTLFKGPTEKVLTVFSEFSSGQFPLNLNQSYLLFIYREHGRLSVDNCGHSGPTKFSGKIISAVRVLSAHAAQRH